MFKPLSIGIAANDNKLDKTAIIAHGCFHRQQVPCSFEIKGMPG